MTRPYSPEADRLAHFAFITALKRERAVRCGTVAPRDDIERRQALSGQVDDFALDCVRGAR